MRRRKSVGQTLDGLKKKKKIVDSCGKEILCVVKVLKLNRFIYTFFSK